MNAHEVSFSLLSLFFSVSIEMATMLGNFFGLWVTSAGMVHLVRLKSDNFNRIQIDYMVVLVFRSWCPLIGWLSGLHTFCLLPG